ncbi:hypothetical protein WJ968_15215 [Achromobacter xylosoxidans]
MEHLFHLQHPGHQRRSVRQHHAGGQQYRKAWAGWPDVPEIEALRLKYAKAADIAERKQIAAQIQKLAIDEGVVAPLGQFQIPAAYSKKLSGVLDAPVTLFWNIGK